MLQLERIEKKYGSKKILDVPSLNLTNGIYWIKGSNGSGKTNFLKMIAGILPFKGNIRFNKIDLKTDTIKYKQNLAWSETEPVYPDFMTGSELIKLYKNVYQTSSNEIELLNLFEMNDWINDKVITYSSGMQKKLSLTLALFTNCKLIILDEPFITIDEDATKKLANYVNENFSNKDQTLLISSHQPLTEYGIDGVRTIEIKNTTAAIV